MPAPVFYLSGSNLSGLGATPAPRTEVTRDQWVQNTNNAWEAANPGKAADLRAGISLSSGMLTGGVVTALFGGYLLATGKTALGAVLALGGIGLGAVGFMKGKESLTPYLDTDPYKTGSTPGVATLPSLR